MRASGRSAKRRKADGGLTVAPAPCRRYASSTTCAVSRSRPRRTASTCAAVTTLKRWGWLVFKGFPSVPRPAAEGLRRRCGAGAGGRSARCRAARAGRRPVTPAARPSRDRGPATGPGDSSTSPAWTSGSRARRSRWDAHWMPLIATPVMPLPYRPLCPTTNSPGTGVRWSGRAPCRPHLARPYGVPPEEPVKRWWVSAPAYSACTRCARTGPSADSAASSSSSRIRAFSARYAGSRR